MNSWTEYRIDFSLITPTGKPCHIDTMENENGREICSIEEAERIAHRCTKSYESHGYTVLSHKIMSRTVTYTAWEEVKHNEVHV